MEQKAASENPNVALTVAEKWGDALKGGFQIVPNVLIRAQHHLKLKPLDVVVLLNLNMHWWTKDQLPYPRPAIMAKRIGVSKRTVERSIENLVEAGLIERLPATENKVRPYRLNGLVKQLQDAVKVGAAQQEYHKMKKISRS